MHKSNSLLKKFFGFLKRLSKKTIVNIENHFIPFRGVKKFDLIMFDNIYPHPVSGFRLEEFSRLLEYFEHSKIILQPNAYPYVNSPLEQHKKDINNVTKTNYELKGKLKLGKGIVNINTKLFYCIFINNIYQNLEWIQKFKIPFVFTLYPGGGFSVNDENCDFMLRSVFASSMFKKVIVTQQFTFDYLIQNKFCDHEKIELIFGGVVPQNSLKKDISDKKYYLKNKTTFDVCFCAAKYSKTGIDKGYDIFIEFAKNISEKYDFVYFHVIGGFDESVINVDCIMSRIKFYGYQNFERLESIYKGMDVFVSPNRPFMLSKGSFDGFPLGTAVEAALNGVVCIISDELKQNVVFSNNEDLIIIDNNSSSLYREVEELILTPQKLFNISTNGRKKFMLVYSNELQIKPRIKLLQKLIDNN
jgi:glycosyltransferase involved in cell wall biosynthesis